MLDTVSRNDWVEMEENNQFQRQLELFVYSSDEKEKALSHLGQLVSGLPQRDRFLDVGAGGGDLTVPLSRHFLDTTALEPNELQAEKLAVAHPDFRVWNCNFEDLEVGTESFDLILCSHVLYYVPEHRWIGLVEEMYDLLSPGGKVVIILQSPAGEMARFFEHFTGRDVPVIGLWDDLVAHFGEDAVEARYLRIKMHTRTLEEMTELGLFLLLDKRFRQRTRHIRSYFAEHHQVDTGYCLHQGEIMLAVTKARTA